MSLRKKLLDTFGAQVSSDHERYPADVKCLGFLYLYVGRYPRNNASRNSQGFRHDVIGHIEFHDSIKIVEPWQRRDPRYKRNNFLFVRVIASFQFIEHGIRYKEFVFARHLRPPLPRDFGKGGQGFALIEVVTRDGCVEVDF